MILVVHSSRSRRGLSLAEGLWILTLSFGVIALILSTHQRELRLAKERRASDMLEHLAGMITLSLPAKEQLAFWVGPGNHATPQEGAGDLATLAGVPELSPDPWGGAYWLERNEKDHWQVFCSNPEIPGQLIRSKP